MTDNTVRLSLSEAFAEAENELSLSGESDETDIPSFSDHAAPKEEQLTVEIEPTRGVLDPQGEEKAEDNQLPTEELYDVTVNGVTAQVGIDELRNGYMRHADYTRKTQELSEFQREAERGLTLIQMLEAKPTETLRKLYQRINSGQPLDFVGETSNSTVEQPKSPTDIEALVEARVAEMLDNDPRLISIRQEKAMAEINDIFAGIEKEYDLELTDSDKQRVLEEAQAQGTVDLPFVFGGLYAKKLAADRQREAEKRNARAVSPTQGQGRYDSHPTPKRPQKYDNFRSALLEEFELEQDNNPQVVSAL